MYKPRTKILLTPSHTLPNHHLFDRSVTPGAVKAAPPSKVGTKKISPPARGTKKSSGPPAKAGPKTSLSILSSVEKLKLLSQVNPFTNKQIKLTVVAARARIGANWFGVCLTKKSLLFVVVYNK